MPIPTHVIQEAAKTTLEMPEIGPSLGEEGFGEEGEGQEERDEGAEGDEGAGDEVPEEL